MVDRLEDSTSCVQYNTVHNCVHNIPKMPVRAPTAGWNRVRHEDVDCCWPVCCLSCSGNATVSKLRVRLRHHADDSEVPATCRAEMDVFCSCFVPESARGPR